MDGVTLGIKLDYFFSRVVLFVSLQLFVWLKNCHTDLVVHVGITKMSWDSSMRPLDQWGFSFWTIPPIPNNTLYFLMASLTLRVRDLCGFWSPAKALGHIPCSLLGKFIPPAFKNVSRAGHMLLGLLSLRTVRGRKAYETQPLWRPGQIGQGQGISIIMVLSPHKKAQSFCVV